MEQGKLMETLKDKSFSKKIVKLQTPEEVQAAFKEKGIEISVEEVQLLGSVINKMVEKQSTELSEKDLEEIAGGVTVPQGAREFWKGFSNTFTNLKYGDIKRGMNFNLWKGNWAPYLKAGNILADTVIIGGALATVYGLYKAVPWAYKKAKGTVNSYRNK